MSVGMCWLLLLSGYVLIMLGGGSLGGMGVYELCLWISEVFATLHVSGGVISVLIPCRGVNFHRFDVALKGNIFFTWPY